MQSICPNCLNQIELPEDSERGHCTCPKCGAEFSVNAAPTVVESPDEAPHVPAVESVRDDLPSLGRFRILGRVGGGSFGIVFKAYDPQLRRLVALKVPRRETVPTSADRQRFLREAQNASQLHHPAIVPTFDLGE